ncbi:MAG TPA: molecular chaperone DnaK, partial [Planctomycetes bacterium]|nr:molecular chaperone DnaK [Planctomycetota bacterium]
LTGIPPAPRGIPQIEVTFDIDADGILHVHAKDKATGSEQRIEIKSSSGLEDKEIERMVREAESHKDEDEKLAKLAETRNHAEQLIYTVEKTLKEHGGKIPDTEKRDVEAAVERLKKAKEDDNADAITSAMEDVTKASHKLAEILYKEASKQQGQEGTKAAPQPEAAGEAQEKQSGGDKVVDAEYRVVDEDNK